LTRPEELGAPAGEDGDPPGARLVVRWSADGFAVNGIGEPAVLTAADGVAEVGPLVTGAVGRLDCVLGSTNCEAALERSSGSRIAPAKVTGRRGPPDIAMAATPTALIVAAVSDNQSVGGRTAGMDE
jgi:hypothetical protein